MQTRPITPARLHYRDGEQVPYSAEYGDVYHARAGALEQAQHVFLRGNSLPQRWSGRPRFVILETGFGLGNNFLATWQAWRESAQPCERLFFLSTEKHPFEAEDLRKAHAHSPLGPLANALIAQWPALTPNIHTLSFEQGRVQLLLALGDARELLFEWVARVDAFFLDGFAPAKNPQLWSPQVFKALSRLAAPEASLATWSTARDVRDGLSAVGFTVSRAPGFANKREMLVARFAPRFVAPAPPGAWQDSRCERHALIIGAGLAGASAAWALAEQGWSTTVVDQHSGAAQAASGNPVGVFHGVVHAQDGPYTRLHRAASLSAHAQVLAWLPQGQLNGACTGLLRLHAQRDDAQAREWLNTLGLPDNYVRWLTRQEASQLAGLALPSGSWHFAQGGWLAPATYVQTLLQSANAHMLLGQRIARISRVAGRWLAHDDDGRVVACAAVLILANAQDAARLLPATTPDQAWSLEPRRGQVTWFTDFQAGLIRSQLPVTGAGYVVSTPQLPLLCGATSDAGDVDAAPRLGDQLRNLQQAQALGAIDAQAGLDSLARAAHARVAWRTSAPDRLPLIGAVPQPQWPGALNDERARRDQPRFIDRLRDDEGGLYVYCALGSRGIAWAALGARVLASWVAGSPCPIEADLRDAVDPARFFVRRLRKNPTTR